VQITSCHQPLMFVLRDALQFEDIRAICKTFQEAEAQAAHLLVGISQLVSTHSHC